MTVLVAVVLTDDEIDDVKVVDFEDVCVDDRLVVTVVDGDVTWHDV